MPAPYADSEIVLGITGSIAAYKAAEIASRLVEWGAGVTPVLTRSARHFLGPATLEGITGRRVITGLFTRGQEVEIEHIACARRASLFLIAPASANILAKAAHGLADDWLSTALLATRAPVLFAPAMNMHMYAHPATQANLEILRERGCHFVGPESGHLACGDTGPGRLMDPLAILEAVGVLLTSDTSLAGRKVLITSGPTREALDPVRYIGNRSSGRMGRALALEALRRKAEVCVVTGPVGTPLPQGTRVIPVESAREMLAAVQEHFPACDLFISAAAVADYRPETALEHKHKRSDTGLDLHLVQNPDIAATMGSRRKPGQVLVGFAAESENLLDFAADKLRRKGLDFILANAVGGERSAIGADQSDAWLLDATGKVEELGHLPKDEVARCIFDAAARLMRSH